MAKSFDLIGALSVQIAESDVRREITNLRTLLRQQDVSANIGVKVDTRGIDRANSSLGQVRKAVDHNTVSLEKQNKSLKEAITLAESFGRQSGLAARRFAAFALPVGIFASVSIAIRNLTRDAIAFEREFIKIAQVTGKTTQSLQGLQKTITDLATGFGVSSEKLVKVATTLAQAGLTAKETNRALEILAPTELSANFDDLTETVEGFIAIKQQFGISVDGMARALDSVNSVSAQFAVESRDIIDAVRKAGGAFAAAGGNLNEFLALFTSVRQTTREGADTIATGFRTIFARLQRPSTVKFLKTLGVELRDLEGNFVGPFEAVNRLNKALTNIDARSGVFSQVIEELGGIRQVSKVIPLIEQFTVAQRALQVATDVTNPVLADAAKAQETIAVQLTKVKEEFNGLFRILAGDQVIRAILNQFLALASAVKTVAEQLEPLIPFIAAIGTARLLTAIPGFARGFRGQATNFGGGSIPGIPGFAGGGRIGGKSGVDQNLARVSKGEYIVSADAARKIGYGNLDRLNEGKVPGFADGGTFGNFADLAKNIVSAVPGLTKQQQRELLKQLGVKSKPPRPFELSSGGQTKSYVTGEQMGQGAGANKILGDQLAVAREQNKLLRQVADNTKESAKRTRPESRKEAIRAEKLEEARLSSRIGKDRTVDRTVANDALSAGKRAQASKSLNVITASDIADDYANFIDTLPAQIDREVAKKIRHNPRANQGRKAARRPVIQNVENALADIRAQAEDTFQFKKEPIGRQAFFRGQDSPLARSIDRTKTKTDEEILRHEFDRLARQPARQQTFANANGRESRRFATGQTAADLVGVPELAIGRDPKFDKTGAVTPMLARIIAASEERRSSTRNVAGTGLEGDEFDKFKADLDESRRSSLEQDLKTQFGKDAIVNPGKGDLRDRIFIPDPVTGQMVSASQLGKETAAFGKKGFGSGIGGFAKGIGNAAVNTLGVSGSNAIPFAALSAALIASTQDLGEFGQGLVKATTIFGGLNLGLNQLSPVLAGAVDGINKKFGGAGVNVERLTTQINLMNTAISAVGSALFILSDVFRQRAEKLRGTADVDFDELVGERRKADTTRGAGLGAIVGGIIGTLILPGLGTVAGAGIGAGAGLGIGSATSTATPDSEVDRANKNLSDLQQTLAEIATAKVNPAVVASALGKDITDFQASTVSDPREAASIQEQLRQQIGPVADVVGEYAKLSSSIKDFENDFGGIGKQLLQFQSDITKVPLEVLRQRVIEEIAARQRAVDVTQKFNDAVLQLQRDLIALGDISAAISDSDAGFRNRANNIENQFGDSSAIKFNGFGDLFQRASVGNVQDENAVFAAADTVLAPFGELGDKLAIQASDASQVFRRLPDILGSVATDIRANEDPNKVGDILGERLSQEFPNLSESIRNAIVTKLQSSDITEDKGVTGLLEKLENPVDLVKQLGLDEAFQQLFGVIDQASKSLDERLNFYAAQVGRAADITNKINDLQLRGVNIRTSKSSFFAQQPGSKPADLTKAVSDGVREAQAVLGNQFGANNQGVDFLSTRLAQLRADRDRESQQEQTGVTVNGRQESAKAFADITVEIDRTKKALELLATSSERLSALQGELESERQVKGFQGNFLKEFIAAAPDQRRLLNQNTTQAVGALAAGSLDGVSGDQRGDVFGIIDQLPDEMVLFGKRVKELKDELFINEGKKLGLDENQAKALFGGQTDKETKLIESIKQAFDIQDKANQALIEDEKKVQADFFTTLETNQAKFLEDLANRLIDAQVAQANSDVGVAQTEQGRAGTARANFASANDFFGLGDNATNTASLLKAISDKSLLDNVRAGFTKDENGNIFAIRGAEDKAKLALDQLGKLGFEGGGANNEGLKAIIGRDDGEKFEDIVGKMLREMEGFQSFSDASGKETAALKRTEDAQKRAESLEASRPGAPPKPPQGGGQGMFNVRDDLSIPAGKRAEVTASNDKTNSNLSLSLTNSVMSFDKLSMALNSFGPVATRLADSMDKFPRVVENKHDIPMIPVQIVGLEGLRGLDEALQQVVAREIAKALKGRFNSSSGDAANFARRTV
jgi:TP901 family phage tail tape measure protein